MSTTDATPTGADIAAGHRAIADAAEGSDFVQSLLEGMARSAEHTQSMLDDIHNAREAEHLAKHAMVRLGLECAAAVWGGTTRDYEDALNVIRKAQHPPREVTDHYREIVDAKGGFVTDFDLFGSDGYIQSDPRFGEPELFDQIRRGFKIERWA